MSKNAERLTNYFYNMLIDVSMPSSYLLLLIDSLYVKSTPLFSRSCLLPLISFSSFQIQFNVNKIQLSTESKYQYYHTYEKKTKKKKTP